MDPPHLFCSSVRFLSFLLQSVPPSVSLLVRSPTPHPPIYAPPLPFLSFQTHQKELKKKKKKGNENNLTKSCISPHQSGLLLVEEVWTVLKNWVFIFSHFFTSFEFLWHDWPWLHGDMIFMMMNSINSCLLCTIALLAMLLYLLSPSSCLNQQQQPQSSVPPVS